MAGCTPMSSDMSEYVRFKDLNAELSRYQPKISYAAFLEGVDKLSKGEKLAFCLVLIGAAKTIFLKAIL